MSSIKLINLFFVLFLMIVSTDTNEEVPYWTQMRRLLKYQSIDTRIVGGQFAVERQAPWMVSLVNIYDLEHNCGGALIGKRTVLTAAHCLVAQSIKDGHEFTLHPSQILVKYDGLNEKLLDKVNKVTKVIMHPNWHEYPNTTEDSYQLRGDIAILHLYQPVIESNTVKIIPIIEETPVPGSEATLTGWGFTRFHENMTEDEIKEFSPNILQTAQMKIISRYQCNHIFVKKHLWQKIQVPRLYICANSQTASACKGDSGSPLVIDGKLIGIVSHTLLDCPINGTTAFSNPVSVRTWINNNIL